MEELKSFCASIATYGGLALFHMEGITPESVLFQAPENTMIISSNDLEAADLLLNEPQYADQVDFVSLGCPHLSLQEIARVADQLKGKKVRKTFWITTARPTKRIADQMGYTSIIEQSGAVFATDTCCVVSPIKGRFKVMATDSAKACYYAASKNEFKTRFLAFDEVIAEALK
jgi:predicted aconitase